MSSASATCSSSTRVRSASTRSRRTVTHVTPPPYSQCHAERGGRVARLDGAARVALDGVAAAEAQVAADGQEPAWDPLGGGDGVPDVVDRRAVGLRDRLHVRRRAVALAGGQGAVDRVDLCLDVHVSAPSSSSLAATRRARAERASSVPSASRCGRQNCSNGVNHSAASWIGSGSSVEAPRALGAHGREARLAQHAEMLRHGGLADAELARTTRSTSPAAVSPRRAGLHDPASDRIPEDIERVHDSIFHRLLI